ncbi:MAG TPA: VWA domain-containing protein [Jatrophihabitantaceae bacterium]|jgi:hypothetical protein
MDGVEIVLGFARTLRHAGVPATPDRVQAMLTALDHLDVGSAADTYWAGRLTLCGDPADINRYDAAFAAYFGGTTRPTLRPRPPAVRLRAVPVDDTDAGPGEEGDDGSALSTAASRHEVLRHRDVSALSAAERDEVRRLLTLLAPQVGRRRTRRYGPAGRGAVDLERTVRRMLHQGGEPSRLARRARRRKPRRLVLLADISGSMEPYADALLRFAHAAVRAAPFNVEVFTLGTRLTRVTRELRHRDPDIASKAAGAAIPDWSGGTRLGDSLKAFLDLWGQRGAARGAVAVLCSDGWERGDPALLGEQVARLSRLAHAVIWVNPHKGKAGYEPVTGGMVAALPYVDRLVAGHSLRALEELVRMIEEA